MDLKNTINNTNTQKDNLKTVANNIDNKLIELGGERATDLADVPNKIKSMIGSYVKTAKGSTKNIPVDARRYNYVDVKIPLNLQFSPSRVICTLESAYKSNNSFRRENTIIYTKNKPSKYDYALYTHIIDIIFVELNKDYLLLRVNTSTMEEYKVNAYWIAIE